MSKFVIISLFALLAVVNARELYTQIDNVKNEIAPLQKESRIVELLEFPALSTIILQSLKAVGFVLNTIFSVIDFKLAALAVAVNAGIWLLSFKFPLLVGAALIFGFCKLTGLCGLPSIFAVNKPDDLDYASEYLDIGMRKFGKSS